MMNSRIIRFATLAAIVVGISILTFGQTKTKTNARAKAVTGVNYTNVLSKLPASDAVVVFDAQRSLTTALPQLLSGNKQLLGDVEGLIVNLKEVSGIDIRQFDTGAAGVALAPVGEKSYVSSTVVVVEGKLSADSVIGAAREAAKGKFRSEMVGTRTIFIFPVSDLDVAANGRSSKLNKVVRAIHKTLNGNTGEMAVVKLGPRMIAFGQVDRVRETALGATKVSGDLLAHLKLTPQAVMGFAATAPSGLSKFLPLDNDDLGATIDSIRLFYGSAEIGEATTVFRAAAQTLQPAQAASLKETLSGLCDLGKALFGSSKSVDKQVYARLLNNTKFDSLGNEVSLVVSIAQPDVDFLVALAAKK